MKLPFNNIIAPLLKQYFNHSKVFCLQPVFQFSLLYTYLYSFVGLTISINHLRKHVGVQLSSSPETLETIDYLAPDFMLVHDLRIIAYTIGLMQYACLLAGCYTENPALFLPHLIGQVIIVSVKIINVLLILTSLHKKSGVKLRRSIPAIVMMTFNWLQEFCVFRQCLCICDL